MASDLDTSATHPGASAEEPPPKKAPSAILQSELHEGIDTLEYPVTRLFISGLSAGLDVGFSLFLMAVMWTVAQNQLNPAVTRILLGTMYSVGFIFVVLGRSELFTEQTTLAVMPVLSGQASLGSLLRLWSVVLVANLIGATAFAGITRLVGPALGVIDPAALVALAHRMTDHGGMAIFLSAVLAGWLMGLLSWLVAAGRDTISQIFLVWLITTAIGFCGLHHVVLGTVEVMAGAFVDHEIKPAMIERFLLWTTLGNIIGGTVFVAIIKYGHTKNKSTTQTPWHADQY